MLTEEWKALREWLAGAPRKRLTLVAALATLLVAIHLQDQWLHRLYSPYSTAYTPKPFPPAVQLDPQQFLRIPSGYRRQRPGPNVERLLSSEEWRPFHVDLRVLRADSADTFRTLGIADERIERGEFDPNMEVVESDRSKPLEWWLRCRSVEGTTAKTGGYVLRARGIAGQNDLLMVAHYSIVGTRAEPAQTAARELINEVKWRE